jgi:hypothetical protein
MTWPHADYTAADVAFEDDLEHVADSGELDQPALPDVEADA